MSVQPGPTDKRYAANGVAFQYAVPFLVIEASDLKVYLNDVLQTHGYTQTGVGQPVSTVIFAVPPTGDLYLLLDVPFQRLVDYQESGDFLSSTVNRDFDRIWQALKQLFRFSTRSLMLGQHDIDGMGNYQAKGNAISNMRDPADDLDAVNNRSMRSYVDQAIAGVVGGFGWFIQFGLGAVYRTFQDKMRDTVHVRDFGAVGDYETDDTAAIINGDLYCYQNGKTLDFGDGVYRCTNGITRKARWKGNFAPTLGTFPITADDKVFLRPGFKSKLPGAALIFSGVGTASTTTNRTDRFGSFTYCVMDDPTVGTPHIQGIAIVMDMDVFDVDGNITRVANDNRSSYDVGYFGTTGWTTHKNFVVFGYFSKGGKLLYGADIDYNTFDEDCSTSGDIGLSILGNGTNGLSGTQYAGRIFANDHHSRSIIDNQWGTTALYIDGNIPSASPPQNSIGGHFFSGAIRTYCDNPFILDHANSVVFRKCVFEWPNFVGSTGATKSLPVGSANTYGVVFDNCRHLNPVGVNGIYQFANSIGGVFIHSDPRHGSLGIAHHGAGIFLRSTGGNPGLQLTTDINGTTKEWLLLENMSAGNRLEARYENATAMTMTTSGTLTANRLVAVLTGSSSATDPSLRLSGSDVSTGLYRSVANNIAISISGTKVADWQADGRQRPGADNVYSLGSSSFRFSEVFAASGNISTSDGRLKETRGELSAQEINAWSRVRQMIFQYKDMLVQKGENARLHAGFVAQQVQESFEAEGLDASKYALWCRDEIRVPVTKTRPAMRQKIERTSKLVKVVQIIDGQPILKATAESVETPCVEMLPVINESGLPVLNGVGEAELYPVPVMEEFEETFEDFEPAGYRLGLRYDQCLVFETAYLRSVCIRLDQRIAALESNTP